MRSVCANFTLPVGEKTTLPELLAALRGARLEVRAADRVVTGRLLSVERRHPQGRDDGRRPDAGGRRRQPAVDRARSGRQRQAGGARFRRPGERVPGSSGVESRAGSSASDDRDRRHRGAGRDGQLHQRSAGLEDHLSSRAPDTWCTHPAGLGRRRQHDRRGLERRRAVARGRRAAIVHPAAVAAALRTAPDDRHLACEPADAAAARGDVDGRRGQRQRSRDRRRKRRAARRHRDRNRLVGSPSARSSPTDRDATPSPDFDDGRAVPGRVRAGRIRARRHQSGGPRRVCPFDAGRRTAGRRDHGNGHCGRRSAAHRYVLLVALAEHRHRPGRTCRGNRRRLRCRPRARAANGCADRSRGGRGSSRRPAVNCRGTKPRRPVRIPRHRSGHDSTESIGARPDSADRHQRRTGVAVERTRRKCASAPQPLAQDHERIDARRRLLHRARRLDLRGRRVD